jgi:hypothetical protein
MEKDLQRWKEDARLPATIEKTENELVEMREQIAMLQQANHPIRSAHT